METISAEELQLHRVPEGSLTLWWLGQAGFLAKSPSGRIVVIDPYLSNSAKGLGEQVGVNLDRLVPPPMSAAELVGVDLYAMTHSHVDHLDPETLAGYRAAGGTGPYLAPAETAAKLRELGVPDDRIVLTWPNHCHSVGDVQLRATFALPFGGDDLTHVGYLLRIDDGPSVYFTGDTAYHELLAIAVGPYEPNILVSAINPAFRNMGPVEAARLAKELDVELAIPCHWDMFPDNSLPPRLLRTNMVVEGIGERYRRLEHGKPFTYPETVG